MDQPAILCHSNAPHAKRNTIGYYLMLLGTLINTLALYTTHLFVWVTRLGVRATARFVWETYTVQGMDPDRLTRTLARPAQLRLIF